MHLKGNNYYKFLALRAIQCCAKQPSNVKAEKKYLYIYIMRPETKRIKLIAFKLLTRLAIYFC